MRVNTPDSYRAGIEASATYNYSTKIGISANIALSKNKINSFTESIYSYDADYNTLGVILRDHKNTDISFSPNIVAASRIRYKIYQNLFTSIESKYVGQQFLDNTSNNDRRIKPFFVNDLFFDYNLRLKEYIPMLTIVFKINNVFNTMYEPNGYTYTIIESGTENNYNYYYPQLGRNYMFSLNFNF
jgi:iron complex outermembrane receptor protein